MRRDALIDRSLEVLLDESLARVVDLVLCRRDGEIEAHGRDGAVGLGRDGSVRWTRGRNPLDRQDPAAFSPLEAELAALRPTNAENHYPYAYENAAQIFDDPRAPDLAVLHTPAHNWEERGGHMGEHGSLDVVQSRAPLILAGAGVKRRGRIEAHARMIDVAPTLCSLLGVAPRDGGGLIAGQDGRVLEEVLDPRERPRRVVAFLCDGTNANVLHAMASAGELPNVARLISEGTAFGHGLMASFPSATLANHTTALTGRHPGRHGVLHNAYYDRATARQIITNAPETWHLARDELSADSETVFEAAARSGVGFTAAVDEPVDRGASYSTFDFLRRGELGAVQSALVNPADVPGATAEFIDKRDFAWATSADHMAVMQATSLWRGDAGNPRPSFLWANLILPDAANHTGGPHSDIGHAGLRDTDRRLGRILDEMDWGGGETAFVLLADHGMEQTDPECKGDFDRALEAAGVPFRDEAYAFVYLDPHGPGAQPRPEDPSADP